MGYRYGGEKSRYTEDLTVPKEEITKLKGHWDLEPAEKEKAIIRIKVTGYSSNKRKLKNYFEKEFKDFSGWEGKKQMPMVR